MPWDAARPKPRTASTLSNPFVYLSYLSHPSYQSYPS